MAVGYKIGLDIGSTTAKTVLQNGNGEIIFSRYSRHNAKISSLVSSYFQDIKKITGNSKVAIAVTGSVGMGLADSLKVPFVQEVIAATEYTKKCFPDISTLIDIGGEDAKVVYFKDSGAVDLRMNGNCAGGTGAFIDQMAIILGIDISEMDFLAANAAHIYPIASRCGVFSKTDVQNLVSNNIDKADIAASIFHAVAVQTVVTLSHGCDIKPKILLCGGPLTFIPSLRKAFVNYLKLSEDDFFLPENANLIPAMGTACMAKEETYSMDQLISLLNNKTVIKTSNSSMAPLFSSDAEHESWLRTKHKNDIRLSSLKNAADGVYLGIDSGSTTTKLVVIDSDDNILFSFYTHNEGNPIQAVNCCLDAFEKACDGAGIHPEIKGTCSTGYGEGLVKTAFKLDNGIIETIAHYIAAKRINPDVSFILDIGGQDMKAIFIDNRVISRIEINEACSSGCGTFIETFARSLNHSVEEFAALACKSTVPCDLGTRCTVFMNSKVKQVLREHSSIADIAAGLSYSVIKNCLFKVLKFKNKEELGNTIVVQGGTMKNDSVVRAFELLIEKPVYRSNIPELMGAYGCALYAKTRAGNRLTLAEMRKSAVFTTRQSRCHGCENNCYINTYVFGNNNRYYSGNKCEKIFSNQSKTVSRGQNIYEDKYRLLFDRDNLSEGSVTLGIPRCLNMYEDYPFWNRLFREAGIKVVLSDPSTFAKYEAGIHTVMSDNICFPAKLVHSHIYNLVEKKVDRIFFPFVRFEKTEGGKTANSYNCPIVTGYSEVIKSAIVPEIPVDSPVISFRDNNVLMKQCTGYLSSLGVDSAIACKAVKAAIAAQKEYDDEMFRRNNEIFDRNSDRLTILLAGRPYHTDPLVQHKISDMIAAMGIDVITEDIVRNDSEVDIADTHLITQWTYINRILKAAKWVASRGNNVHFIQLTSFGCGPDAFLLDEIRTVLNRGGKALTILKIDDINNIGSMKLRVRSLVDSVKFNDNIQKGLKPFETTKVFTKEDRRKKILAPYFTDYISPLMSSAFKCAGYDFEILPESDYKSADEGLKYANNEVCYPATLVVGDLIKALKSGRYDLDNTAVAISQTGGQCRATNYIALIKKGMVEAGFKNIPVVAVALGSGLINEQPGFHINWVKMMPIALASILYGDAISKFYHASAIRERHAGDALRLRDEYLKKACPFIEKNNVGGVYGLISEAARDFNAIIVPGIETPKIGIVGEIYLKFNSFAHQHIVRWLISQGIEIVPPMLIDFFTQCFVNRKVNVNDKIYKGSFIDCLYDIGYKLISKQIEKVNGLASEFRYFMPFNDIFTEAEYAKEILSLSVQFGEGWLLPGEVVSCSHHGVNNVISLQPFGCIANHIITRGVEKKIKTLYPDINLLALDFDSGVSPVNVTNRLLLFINNIRDNRKALQKCPEISYC